MNEDRIAGGVRNLTGQVEEGYGRVAGDPKSELAGKLRQAEGGVQEAYGQVKDQHPYTTAAVALAIGYVIGRLGSRDY